MSVEELLSIIWRRRLIVLLTVIVATMATYVAGSSLDDVYEADATLVVSSIGQAGSDFEATDSARVLVRTFAELIQSDSVAQRVVAEIDSEEDPEELLDRMGFEPIEDTRLLIVNAEGSTPAETAQLANDYAEVFAEFATNNLTSEAQGTVGIADRAVAPTQPVRPTPVLYAGVMFVLSVFLGSALAVLRDRLEKRLGTEEEISRDLDMPVLARVPVFSMDPVETVLSSADPSFLEAFKVLAANLEFLPPDERPTNVLITSPGPGEGKTTCCAGLARAMTEQGRRVTLIEADLRRPRLTSGGNGTGIGLARMLAEGQAFESAVQETEVANLFILPAGSALANPSTVLRSDALVRLLGEASAWSDFVIVDSPPVSVGPDALLLAREVDGSLLTVSSRRTQRSRAVTAARQLRRTGTPILGAILNELPEAELDYSSYAPDLRARGRLLPVRRRHSEPA